MVERAADQIGGAAVEFDQAIVFLTVECGAATGVQQDRGGAALPQADAAAAVAGRVEQVHGAAGVHRGAGQGHAVLLHLMAGQGDVAGGRHDQAAVGHRSRRAARLEAGGDFIATGGGTLVTRRAHAFADVETVTGRQGSLALGGDDGAGVFHVAAQQQGIAAGVGGGGGVVGLDQCAALHLNLARRVGECRLGAIGVDIQAALGELFIGDVRRRRYQVAHVDLAGAAEHHTVTVHDHHRPGALDLALDFAGASLGVVDAVEYCPGGLLLEVHRGVAPDVEGFPIEDRLVGGLLDAHRGLAAGLGLGRRLGVGPALGQAVVHLQAAFAQAIGNRRHLAERRLPAGGLSGLLRRNRRDAGVQGADGTRQLLIDPRLLVQGRHRRHLPGTDARRRGRLGRPLGREPRRTERSRRRGVARHHP